MEKISVIVPIYKVEKYLSKCIESIINQTYKELEIILVNDGSPDGSGKIIDEYAAKDPRIIVIHKENGGCSSARNCALDIATGSYITFADSDDILNEREYEVLYDLIKKYNADISFCELETISSEEFELYPNINLNKKEIVFEKEYSVEDALKEIILNGNVGNYVPIKLFKKELFNDLRFTDKVYYEDVALLYKVVARANKIAYTNESLYYYQVNREGATTASFNEKKIIDSLTAYYAQYKYILERYPSMKEVISYNWVRLYTSAMEKICMNNYDMLYENEIVLKKYDDFKKAYENVSKEFMINKLEPYRLISATLINEDRSLYKAMFDCLYNKLK